MIVFGGYLLAERQSRVQLPVIEEPDEKSVGIALSPFELGRGVASLVKRPRADVGSYDLTLHADAGIYLLMLSELDEEGEHDVRTVSCDGGDGRGEILGDYCSVRMVSRDFKLVRRCFSEFLRTGEVSHALMS